MKFGPLPVDQAAGAILAHSVQGAAGRIAKGTVLGPEHLADLRAGGHAQITAALLEPGDVEENAAAMALAQALVPDAAAQGLRLSGAGAGRVNLIATGPGLVQLDAGRIAALNDVDPMITVATLAQYARVTEGAMVATIKIIAYAVPGAALARAQALAGGAIGLRAPIYDSATLIETRTDAATPPDKGRRATAARLERLGAQLTERVIVPHQEAPLADAIRAAPGQVVLILTASATSDTLDVAPQALRAAGGSVTRFGMPVDPGNLLFLGDYQGKPVIGLPGCARSPALNGADWVLERLLCGLTLSAQDIAAMGVGGLLKEIPTRPRPRRG